jgi:hypothetical protein
MSDRDRAQALARQIRSQLRPLLDDDSVRIGLSTKEVDSVLSNVASQSTYLGALRAADPFVEATVQESEKIFSRLRDAQRRTKREIEHRIDSSFSGTMENLISIERTQTRLIRHYAQLDLYRSGDLTALDAVLSEDPSLRQSRGDRGSGAYGDIAKMEAEIVRRLGDVRGMREQLAPDWQYYQNAKLELDSRFSDVTDFIRRSRTAVAVWAQSHRNLAEGISVPPILDLSAIAKDVVGKIVP